MSLWMRWEAKNPMLAETRIIVRRWIGFKTNTLQTKLIIGGIFIVLIGIILAVAQYATFVDTSVVFPIAWVLVGLISIITLHGSLAREREKRSMEVLMTVPLTARQIVFGKLFRSLPAIGTILVAVPVLLLASGIGRAVFKDPGLTWGPHTTPALVAAVLMLYLMATALYSMTLTMAISSITSRVAPALLLSFSLWIVTYLVIPIVVSAMTWSEGGFETWHPMGSFFSLIGFGDFDPLSPLYVIVWQLGLSYVFLAYAVMKLGNEARPASTANSS